MPGERSLLGKVAIVTGSAKPHGIGAAIALTLAEYGANVVIHYMNSAAPAKETASKARALGVKAVIVQADASARDFGSTLVNAALEAFGTNTIDIIINNAATSMLHENIAAIPFEAWDETFHVNVRGPFMLIQASLPYMKEGGRIINISSIIAKLGSYKLPVYGASKGALNSMTVAMAEELGPRGITINIVAPGPIKIEPITTDLSMEETPIAKRLVSNQHIKRVGTTKEVADVVLFMASPSSSYITGQLIPVDGGIGWP